MAYKQVGYQYETSPRKLKPEYEPKQNPYSKKKKSTALKTKPKEKAKVKRNLKPHVKQVMYILVGFVILFAISYRNSLITESFDKKEELKKELSVLQKENAQTEISIQSSLNLANVQKSAQEMLGMQKIEEAQKVYINLPKKDYVEAAGEQVELTQQKRWYEKIIDGIMDIIK